MTIRDQSIAESNVFTITLTATPTIFAVEIEFTIAVASAVELFFRKVNRPGDTMFLKAQTIWLVEGQNGNSNPPSYVPFNQFFNASDRTESLTGIRWYNTANGSTVDPTTRVVTELAGPTLANVGYAPKVVDGDICNAGVNYPAGGWTAVVEATGPSASNGVGVGDVALCSASAIPIAIYMPGIFTVASITYGAPTLNVPGSDWRDTLLRTGISAPDTIGGTLFLAATGLPTTSGVTTTEDLTQIGIGHRGNTSQFQGIIHDVNVEVGSSTQVELEDLVAFP